MIKSIFKSLSLIIILTAIIVLILGIVFYDSIPINKIVPEKVQYTLPDNLQEELDRTLEAENQEVIVTYTINEKDLQIYESNNSYNPGKVDPFAAYSVQTNPTTDKGGSTENSSNNSDSSKEDKDNNSNQATGGELFEDGTSK